MAINLNFLGTGGIIEGNLGSANVNVNLDPVLDFDANSTEEHILVADHADFDVGTGAFSTSWWMKTTNTDEFYVVSKMVSAWPGFRYGCHSDGHLQIQVQDSSGVGDDHNGSKDLDDGSWHHICVTLEGPSGAWKGYVDGVLEISETAPAYGSLDNANGLSIGAAYTGQAQPFDGQLADVRFWKGEAVSADDVKVLASKINVDPSLTSTGTTNLKGWWKLNEGTGTTATDSSGNSKNGTLTNFSGSDYWQFDAFSVDVYDNSTTTDGTFTVTQGKVECLALSSLLLDGTGDYVNLASSFTMSHDGSSVAVWVKKDNATGNEDVIIGQASDPNLHWMKIDTNGDVIFRDYPNDLHCDTAITDTNWHHIVVTLSGDSNGAIYVDGVAQTLSANAIVGDPTFDVIGIRGTIDDFDGKLRDLKVFDYALSAEQAASLYSNTYPQTPKHNWKMDEGTGATANDTGTGTAANGTLNGNASLGGAAHTQTLDLDNVTALTIQTNGIFSAPRGKVQVAGDITGSGKIIHNNGTFESNRASSTVNFNFSGTGVDADGNAQPMFYDVLCTSATTKIIKDTSIARELHIDSSATFKFNCNSNAVTLTMGTTSSAGEIHQDGGGFHFENNTSNAAKIVAADTSGLNPWFNISGYNIDWDSGGSGSDVELANGNYSGTVTTGGGGVTVTLTGDMEFDAVTVSSGDTLDLNGQRMKCDDLVTDGSSGDGGILDLGSNSLLYCTNLGVAGKVDNEAGANIIIRGDGAGDDTDLTDYYFVGDTSTNIMIDNGSISTDWRGSNNYLGNLIIGSGTFRSIENGAKVHNLTVATGATLDLDNDTVEVAGDFTTSGGLLGASCLELNGSDEFAAQTSATTWGINSAYTIEMWLKTSTDSNMTLFDMDNGSDNANRIEIACNASTNEIKLTAFASDGTETALFTGNVFGQDFHDGKWHHLAVTNSGSEIKIYADGKLNKQLTATVSRSSDPSMRLFIGKKKNDSQFFDGEIEEVRIFTDVRTEAEIRADMFQGGTLANSGNLSARYSFDEGSGTAVDNSETTAARDLVASGTGVWAGAGTFTYGTSTLTMTGTSKKMNLPNAFDVYNLIINGTITANWVNADDSYLKIRGTVFTVGSSKTLSTNGYIRLYDEDLTLTFNTPATNISGVTTGLQTRHSSGTLSVPEVTTTYLLCETSGGTTQATGDLTITTELQVASGTTFNANGNTIDAKEVDVNGGTLDLRNSTCQFKTTGSNDKLDLSDSSTLLTGNTLIEGHNATNHTWLFAPAAGNFEVVGTLKFMSIQNADGDITVIGSVINCSEESGFENQAMIRQWHHTLDTQQLLDADEAGDDDLRLEKPNLDNANELQTG